MHAQTFISALMAGLAILAQVPGISAEPIPKQDLIGRQVVVIGLCCRPGCDECSTEICSPDECVRSILFTTCCATIVSGSEVEDGNEQWVNERGDPITLVDI